MNSASLANVFIEACVINNFVLSYFLGLCPFLGVSGKFSTALKMGIAVTFVMLVSSVCAFCIHAILVLLNAEYLQLICFVVVIASTVQLVEIFVKKTSPKLFKALGIFLPLITTNCAILGVALFQTNREYSFPQCIAFALGAGAGFTLALLMMAGLREELKLAKIPNVLRGTGLTLMIAGVLSLVFMGFAGLGG